MFYAVCYVHVHRSSSHTPYTMCCVVKTIIMNKRTDVFIEWRFHYIFSRISYCIVCPLKCCWGNFLHNSLVQYVENLNYNHFWFRGRRKKKKNKKEKKFVYGPRRWQSTPIYRTFTRFVIDSCKLWSKKTQQKKR